MGAKDWMWHHHSWGVVLELEFPDTKTWDAWRASVHVQSALEAVPDPLSGLIVYRGRGGTSGTSRPRRPRPLLGSGSAALPLPWEWHDEGPTMLPPTQRRFLSISSGGGIGVGLRPLLQH
jgi:hypothetical protein